MAPVPPPFYLMTEARKELPAITKLTAAGLISIGFCLVGMLFLVYGRFQVSPVAFSLLAFGIGGAILSGRPWAPALAPLFCLLFLGANWNNLDGFEDAAHSYSIHLYLLLSPILLVTFLAGLGATIRTFFTKAAFGKQPARTVRGTF